MRARTSSIRFVILALAGLALAACGSGGDSDTESVPSLLLGSPATIAVNALTATGPTAAASDERSGSLLLTRIEVTLAETATVEQVNMAAGSIDATGIGYSQPGSPLLALVVPRQSNGTLAEAGCAIQVVTETAELQQRGLE